MATKSPFSLTLRELRLLQQVLKTCAVSPNMQDSVADLYEKITNYLKQ